MAPGYWKTQGIPLGSKLSFQLSAEQFHLFTYRSIAGYVFGDGLDGIEDRGMVTVIHVADVG